VAVARPTAQLSAGAAQVDCGGSTQLKWSTSEAPRVEISGAGEVAASGEQTVQPKQTTTYKLTASGPGGVASSEATVNVSSTIQASLSVTPAEIRYHKVGDKVDQQGSASLSWSASGADTASLDPLGSVSPTGNRTVQPTPSKTGVGPIDETITYSLHSSNACGGSDTQTAALHIVGSIEVPQEATVQALEAKLSLNSIYFPTSLPTAANPKGGLVPSQQQRLQELATNFKQYLQLRTDAHLLLQAHADKRGTRAYNMALSERRAARVRSFLVEQGIAESTIEDKWFGKEQNLDAATVKQLTEQNPNLTPDDRKRVEKRLPTFLLANNRRVDVVLSTTGQKSLQYYPYNSEDLKVLLGPPPKAQAAPRKAKAKVKK
jgi:outer membrane protein OmpA-like peptidoglycan-associated protein